MKYYLIREDHLRGFHPLDSYYVNSYVKTRIKALELLEKQEDKFYVFGLKKDTIKNWDTCEVPDVIIENYPQKICNLCGSVSGSVFDSWGLKKQKTLEIEICTFCEMFYEKYLRKINE